MLWLVLWRLLLWLLWGEWGHRWGRGRRQHILLPLAVLLLQAARQILGLALVRRDELPLLQPCLLVFLHASFETLAAGLTMQPHCTHTWCYIRLRT
jgi:hypothetical protein